MAPDGPVDVPIAWLEAEQVAQDLIAAASDGPVSPARFEFRATRDVLALTLFLTGVAARSTVPTRHLEVIRERLSETSEWLAWCTSRLDGPVVSTGAANLRLARNAWLWLQRSRRLDATPLATTACCDTVTSTGAGCHLGLPHARRIIARCLAGNA
jgi:hypothetical protein